MKKLLLSLSLTIISMVGFAQTKQAVIQATQQLKADNELIWAGDTIRKNSIVYGELKPDSIRFQYIDGTWTNWLWDWGIRTLTNGNVPYKSGNKLSDSPLTTDGTDMYVPGKLGSPTFVSGFTGSGWQINDSSHLTLDYLTVRKSLRAYEMLISKIRAVNGGLVISAANATADSVYFNSVGNNYQVFPEDTTISFVANDIVRCQVFTGTGIKYYSGVVDSLSTVNASYWIHVTNGSDIPASGDEQVQFGNTTNTSRQGLIYITANDDGSPYIDVLDGVNSSDLTGKTKARYGKLSGITSGTFGQLSGYGMWSNNIYAEGHLATEDGQSVSTQFSVVNGEIASKVSQTDFNTLDGRVAANESSITQNANEIATKVRQTEFDSLQVGGVNLMLNTVDYSNKITFTAPSDDYSKQYSTLKCDLVAGRQYTFSIKTDGTWGGTNGTNTVEAFLLKDNAYTYYIHMNNQTFTFVPSQSGTYNIRLDINQSGATHSFWDMQVEDGNRSTTYSPSPLDFSSRITTNESSITQNASSITTGFSVVGANGYTRTGQTEFTVNGMTVYNGGITIKNDAGTNVLSADVDGNLSLTGNINASSGTIGGMNITTNSITSSNGNLSLTSSGGLVAKSATIYGSISNPFYYYHATGGTYSAPLGTSFNLYIRHDTSVGTQIVMLPTSSSYDGAVVNLILRISAGSSRSFTIVPADGNVFLDSNASAIVLNAPSSGELAVYYRFRYVYALNNSGKSGWFLESSKTLSAFQ